MELSNVCANKLDSTTAQNLTSQGKPELGCMRLALRSFDVAALELTLQLENS